MRTRRLLPKVRIAVRLGRFRQPARAALAAGCLLGLHSVHARAAELKVTGDRFSLVLPSREWQVVTTPTDKAALVVLGPPQRGRERSVLTVVTADGTNGGGRWQTAEGFREGVIEALKQDGATIESTEYPLGAQVRVKATLATAQDDRSDYLTVVALHGGVGYALVFATPKGTLPTLRPQINRILRSFRFVSIAQGDRLDFQRYGFTIRLPERGWVRSSDAEKEDEHLVLALQKAGDPETAPIFSVFVGDVPSPLRGPGALDALAADMLRSLRTRKDVTVREIQKGALSSQPSLTVRISGLEATGEVVLVVRDRLFYQITLSAPPDQFEKQEPELLAILNSIRFTDRPPRKR